jgi:redox-sensitive bicupin YhaK (pirin superfamily)
MNNIRTIKKVIKGMATEDGAGVKLVRVFGHNDTKDFDPFLMLDAFDSINPIDYINGFPWHPHRGIETITYLITGEIDHGDSLGNSGKILSGGCQWMTAGSGIIHQEMPQPSNHLLGVQIWLNLPAKKKMTKPQYRDIKISDIPVIPENDCLIHVVSGVYKNTKGALISNHVQTLFLDIELSSGGEWRLNTDDDVNLFIYIIKGSGVFDSKNNKIISEKNAILFNDGNQVVISAQTDLRFLLLTGRPLKEPIAWGGPIVMNTQEELDRAFREIDNGTFEHKE